MRESFAGGSTSIDPWAYDGLPLEGGANDSALDQAYQYRAWAYQQLQSGINPQDQQAIMIYLQQLDQWIQQYEQGMGEAAWGDNLNGYGPQGPTPQTGPVPDYQDLNQIVYENGSAFTYEVNKEETREVHLYQPAVDIEIPSNASSVNVSVASDSTMPGKNMAVVTVTYTDGSTRKIYVHHIDRSDALLTIHAPSIDQIALDASTTAFEDKIKTGRIGEASEVEQIQGTPPDETTDTTRIWNHGDNVDYYVTEGEEIDEIYTDTLNLAVLNRSYKVEVTKTGEHAYDIVVKDAEGNSIRTIHARQINSLNFSGVDEENFFFQDAAQEPPTGLIAWGDPSHPTDDQLTVGGVSGAAPEAEALNPAHPEDTLPTSVEGAAAVYSTEENVSVHTYYEGDITTCRITAPGTVDLYPQDFNDEVEIVDGGEVVFVSFKNAEGQTITYEVKGPPSRIVIHALPSHVKVYTSGQLWKNFNELDASEVEDWFANVEVPGSQVTANPIDTEEELPEEDAVPELFQSLAALTGKTDAEINSIILDFYNIDFNGDGKLSEEELQTAKNNHVFPPSTPDSRFFEFLYHLDSDLATSLNEFAVGNATTRDSLIGPLRDRLVLLLGKFYEEVQSGGSSDRQIDNIFINGTEYDFLRESVNGLEGDYMWNSLDQRKDDPWNLLDLDEQNT